MIPNETDQLLKFYEDRFANGYMENWPLAKRQRIAEVIQRLNLPEKGQALDFGCGTGVLTNILKETLPPSWDVYGMDISKTALERAAARYPTCRFFHRGYASAYLAKFDFVFTHHVLEHVYDLERASDEIASMANPECASLLHILPCGNKGSFEHSICLLRKDGVDSARENRFFYEDESHLRRLTTEQVRWLFYRHGYRLEHEYYSNHHYGAIEWITRSRPSFLLKLTDTTQATDPAARKKFSRLRWKLLAIWILRSPVTVVERTLEKRKRDGRDYLLLIAGAVSFLFGKPVDNYVKSSSLKEWTNRKTDRSGSEMYLHFKR